MSRVRVVAGVVVAALVGTLSVALAWGEDTTSTAATVPAVTLRATPGYLIRGETVMLSGRATNARSGSVVKLQRRADGVWVTVAQKRTADDRSFEFRRTPSVGSHRFRVVKPGQYAQARAVSPTVTVVVVGSERSVTLEATPADLIEGDAVVLSGRATNAVPGSVVKLQLGVDGGWSTVAQAGSADDGTFAFRRTPAAGSYDFRVVMPQRPGQPQAVSDTVTIRVGLPSTITGEVSAFLNADNMWVTVIRGTAPANEQLLVQRHDQAAGSWIDDPEMQPITSDPEGAYEARFVGEPAGTRYRLRTVADGLGLPAYSPTITIVQRPVPLQMNGSTVIRQLVADLATGWATMSLDADAGDVVTVALEVGGQFQAPKVTAPDGSPVPYDIHPFPRNMTTFTAQTTGRYLIEHRVSTSSTGAVTVWASTPKVYDWGDWCCNLRQDLPGQMLEQRIPAQAGDMIWVKQGNYTSPMPDRTMFGPTGAVEEPVLVSDSDLPAYDDYLYYRVPDDGVRTLRYTPSKPDLIWVGPMVRHIPTVEAEIDGPQVEVGRDSIPGIARVTFHADAGDRLLLTFSRDWTIISPSGIVDGAYREACIDSAEAGWYDALHADDTRLFKVERVNHCPK
jgi:hypothetical protein